MKQNNAMPVFGKGNSSRKLKPKKVPQAMPMMQKTESRSVGFDRTYNNYGQPEFGKAVPQKAVEPVVQSEPQPEPVEKELPPVQPVEAWPVVDIVEPVKRASILIIVLTVVLAILSVVAIVLMVLVFTKQLETGEVNVDQAAPEVVDQVSSNCEITKCVEQIGLEMSLEEVNQLIGFEGTLVEEGNEEYVWDFGDGETLKIDFGGAKDSVVAELTREKYADAAVDFARYDEIRTLMDSDAGANYDQVVEIVGGAPGVIIEKTLMFTRYLWVNEDGGYMKGLFENVEGGKCVMVEGRF